ncbi:MAG: hypothetical protein K2X34_12380 [Hyphomonadaceae bacterium]|nr:hypothetical protein [Hyphomonadaceae bacterium]
MRALAFAAATLVSLSAAPASAAPVACANGTASASAPVVGGEWELRFLDDGSTDWAGPYTHVFNADGAWTENGNAAGSWCMVGDLLIYSWDDDPQTTFRIQFTGAEVMTGMESWNGAGTGIVELRRRSGGGGRTK